MTTLNYSKLIWKKEKTPTKNELLQIFSLVLPSYVRPAGYQILNNKKNFKEHFVGKAHKTNNNNIHSQPLARSKVTTTFAKHRNVSPFWSYPEANNRTTWKVSTSAGFFCYDNSNNKNYLNYVKTKNGAYNNKKNATTSTCAGSLSWIWIWS